MSANTTKDGVAVLSWECVQNQEPRKWALGIRRGMKVEHVKGIVWRIKRTGQWAWESQGFSGTEPSRDTAMDAVEVGLVNHASTRPAGNS